MYRPRKRTNTSASLSSSNTSRDDRNRQPETMIIDGSDSAQPPSSPPPPPAAAAADYSATVAAPMDFFETDTPMIDEREFRRALDVCYTQSQNSDACKLNLNKVNARNAFEELLEELRAELRTNVDDEIAVYLPDGFHGVVKKVDAYCDDDNKRANFFRLFEEEIVEDDKLRIYLSPAATETGYVDTFIRALLTAKSSQAATFELMLKKIETFAKSVIGDESANDHLALACIAQFRYVDTIYEPKRVFNSIFDCDLENWRSAPRDALIRAMPEILPIPAVQQDTANNLQQMFLKKIHDNQRAFRSTILQTLSLLRTNEQTANSIRGTLLKNIMKLETELLPEVVKYCLASIQRSEKFAFRNVMYSLRTHLQIQNLNTIKTGKISKNTIGDVLSEIFEIILKKLKTGGDGRYWKDAVTVLSTEGQQQMDEENESNMDEFTQELIPVTKKELILFDVLFCFALMDSQNLVSTMHNFFKQQISRNRHSELEKLVEEAFEYTEFITRFFRPILNFWQSLMWSAVPIYIQFGAFGYKILFLKLRSQQPAIFNCMLFHLNEMEQETSAMLTVIQDIAQIERSTMTAFIPAKLSCLINFSFDNVCRFFNILLSVQRTNERSQISGQQHGLEFEIERMISSSSIQEKLWGILGVLMELQQYLINSRLNSDDRENMIKQKLTLLDERTKSDAYLRTCFYEHFARILNMITVEIDRSAILVAWAERMCLEFKRDFLKQLEEISSHCRLEDERYTTTLCKEWFCLGELLENSSKVCSKTDSTYRIFAPIAHFRLLLSLTKLKHLWAREQENSEDFLHELLFVLEANISMSGLDLAAKDDEHRILNCDIFFFSIQWIRLVLNTFVGLGRNPSGIDAEVVQDLLRKKFALMMECQKSLNYTIQKIGRYKIPYSENFERTETVIFHEIGKKSSIARIKKRAVKNTAGEDGGGDVGDVGNDDEEENAGDARNKKNMDDKNAKTTENEPVKSVIVKKNLKLQKMVELRQLSSCFIPLSFTAVIRLISLIPKKRKQTTFLLHTLSGLLGHLLYKKDKKVFPFMVTREKFGIMAKKSLEDDNPKIIWRSIHSVIPTLFAILHGAVEYFNNLLDTSTAVIDGPKRPYHADMIALMHSSLLVFNDIFSSKDLMKTSGNDATDEERSQRLRMERRKLVFEKLERAMIDAEAVDDTQGAEDSEAVVSSYFLKISEMVPSVDCAVALLNLLSCDFVSGIQKAKVAKSALLYLKKEWSDPEGNVVKGAPLNRAVSSILRLYLSFREPSERFSAIQWLLANKISEMVPEEERRRSKISSLEPCHDKELDETEGSCHFICFNSATFGSIYKVLFCSLNETIKSILSVQAIEKGKIRENDCFTFWKIAASCFCLLTLLLRVKELRNASVLLTAAREGRIFLQNFVVKSSFMYLLSGETRFVKYGTGANAVMKTVQIGNRSLQNMSSHAKSTKCASLLKLLPQLRATSEQFIREVHKIMVGVDCDGAFQIGLLKSRNLDGEELKEVETVEDSESENSQHGLPGDDDQNEDLELAEEQSDVDMDLVEDSPVF